MNHRLDPLFETIQSLRKFFDEHGVREVFTPLARPNPGMEVHLHAFQLHSVHRSERLPFFLHSSPEFAMKKLLTEGMDKIYTLSSCFRDEPVSATHRPEFLMLEWYRKYEPYQAIMQDCREILLRLSNGKLQTQTLTVKELFLKEASLDLDRVGDKQKFHEWITQNHPTLAPNPKELTSWSWDDLFFLIFLNIIEPQLKKYPALILKEYPSSQAALAKIKADDPTVCERFELYLSGLEIANCFHEETDHNVIQQRFIAQTKEKKQLYGHELPWPKEFMQTMKNYPPSSGIALGVERLAMAIFEKDDLFLHGPCS